MGTICRCLLVVLVIFMTTSPVIAASKKAANPSVYTHTDVNNVRYLLCTCGEKSGQNFSARSITPTSQRLHPHCPGVYQYKGRCNVCGHAHTWFASTDFRDLFVDVPPMPQLKTVARAMPLKEAAKLKIVGTWTDRRVNLSFDGDGEIRASGLMSKVGRWYVPDQRTPHIIKILNMDLGHELFRWEVKKGQLRLQELNPANNLPFSSPVLYDPVH